MKRVVLLLMAFSFVITAPAQRKAKVGQTGTEPVKECKSNKSGKHCSKPAKN